MFRIRLPQGPQMHFFPTSLSAALWLNPTRGQEETDFLLSRLRPGDTFVDVGANVGWLTLLAAQRVGPSGCVVAIEPHPRTFGFLSGNVQLNGFSQVRLVHAAAGSRIEHTYVSDLRSDDMNHLGPNAKIKVPVITLDSLGIAGRVAVLKTDTEGFEPFVMEGATDLISRVNCIQFECSEWNLRRYRRNSHQLRAMVQSRGFRIFQQVGRSLLPVNGNYDAAAGGNLLALRET